MKKTVLPVKELYKYSKIEIRDYLREDMDILFEDNVVISMRYKEIILLRFILEVYLPIQCIPIVSKHSFTNYYTNGILTAKTINKAFEKIFEDVVELYCKKYHDRKVLENLFEAMFKSNNDIYNELIYNLLEYSNSISVLDLLEIQMDKELINAMVAVSEAKDKNNSYKLVQNTYKILDKILRNKPEVKNNIISRGYLSGTMNPNQIKQLLASRGHITEIDGTIFHKPIASSFTLGLVDIYDLAIESRAAAKALSVAGKGIQDAEYLARELQLITMLVERLVDCDCGSTDYLEWLVRPVEVDENGTVLRKSDIDLLLGKYFLNEETNQLEVITSNHKHLEGKTIKLRSAMKCKLPDDSTICTTCFGDLAYNIPLHANLGHFCSVTITGELSQGILSTKHLTSSATTDSIILREPASRFFVIKDNNIYTFQAGILNGRSKVQIVLNKECALGLKDINASTDVYKLNPSSISKISSFELIIENGKHIESYPIIIKDSNKYGFFSSDFLNYVAENNFKLDDEDRYIIDISNWDGSKAFIEMPEVEFSFQNLVEEFKTRYKSINNKTKIKANKGRKTPEFLVQNIFDLLNRKININLAIIEVLIYAVTVKSLKDGDYRLGRNGTDVQIISDKEIRTRRSLGAGYAWEEHNKLITSPLTYYGMNSIDHPLDVMVRPSAVLRKNKK